MSDSKRPSHKRIIDVAHPGTAAPAPNSKSVIVSNRPLLKDPMMVDDDNKPADAMPVSRSLPTAPLLPGSKVQHHTTPLKTEPETSSTPAAIEPTTPNSEDAETTPSSPDSKVAQAVKDDEATTPELGKPTETDKSELGEKNDHKVLSTEPDNDPKNSEEDEDEPKLSPAKDELEAETAEQAAHETAVQGLVDSKKYALPINAVEKRKSKRFVLLGILLSLVLAVAWADIALDAGLIHINGVKPLTHFFSN